jgi:hypothetical protein
MLQEPEIEPAKVLVHQFKINVSLVEISSWNRSDWLIQYLW